MILCSFLFSALLVISIPNTSQAAAENKVVTKKQLHILAFGDSLTAGFGLQRKHSFPSVLEKTLRLKGYRVRVTNAGVSGDTTTGGRARIEWSLADTPDLVLLALGANDALRGQSPQNTRNNLAAIIEACIQHGAGVLLLGMYAPVNMGKTYGKNFNAIYPELARQYSIPLYPFLLEGVALNPKLNQLDGIHPTAKGVTEIVNRLLPYVENSLRMLSSQK